MNTYFSLVFLLWPVIQMYFIVDCKWRSIVFFQPEQIHIAFGDNPYDRVITWTTANKTPNSLVKYGPIEMNETSTGTMKQFVDGGKYNRVQFIHRAYLPNLKPELIYSYHCGSDLAWSEKFTFKTGYYNISNYNLRVAILGDMGNKNARSLKNLQEGAQSFFYDAIIHVGDMAYNMEYNNGQVGDQFMKQIQPVAAYVPYMVCPGNHEQAYNFSHFRERFSMPGHSENLFYSFNLGPIHFISINTEAYYFLQYGMRPLTNQYEWLENDLKEANLPLNRVLRPWVITYGHRPMYCSADKDHDCKSREARSRVGLPVSHWYSLEKLFYKHHVDICFWGHMHSYERSWPMYDYIVRNGSSDNAYQQPMGPIHIITGTGGCYEGLYNYSKIHPPWSAFRYSGYGYTTLESLDAQHLRIQQLSVENEEKIVDEIIIEKNL